MNINRAVLLPLVIASMRILDPSSASCQSSNATTPVTPTNPVEDLSGQIQRLGDQVAEVRRGQLNYQIERDLLKETYGSNLQTVQLVLTMILGAFTILGYLGFRGINSIRKEFQDDLIQFRAGRSALEMQLNALVQAQARAESQVSKLERENQEQDRRLRGLEIREKAVALMAQNNLDLALDYLNLGLTVTPDDTIMMAQKALCLGRLGRLTEAIVVSEEIQKVLPGDRVSVRNLMELYLLNNRVADFDALYNAHQDIVKNIPLLDWYFQGLKLLFANNLDGLKQHIAFLSTIVKVEKSPKLGWFFNEMRIALAGKKDLIGKSLFLEAIQFIEGSTDGTALFAQVIPAPPGPTKEGGT